MLALQSTLVCCMIFWVNKDVMETVTFIKLLFAYLVLSCNMISVALVVQNFFNEPKLAGMVVPNLLIIPTTFAFIAIILPISTGTSNTWV